MPKSRPEQKGATPLNSEHPATRSFSKQIIEEEPIQSITDNFQQDIETMKSAVKQEVTEVMAVTPHSMPTQNFQERQVPTQYRQDYVCFGCGKSCTNRRLCPAFNVKCFKCDRVGHFKEVCGLNLRSYPRSNNRQPHPSQSRNFNSRHPNSSA
ncbi:unnamed protein product [Mytilus edulis]|uniref:CCHC-type domain-containing protein n=1 Tax=Mytilus edulis TaxID=6550 RepID=A0A8S3UX95_MYTED|nr:unnamed protein product [Mytilus edulis]